MASRQELVRHLLAAGMARHREGSLDAAKSAYKQALALAPDHPQALNLAGVAALQLGDPGHAVGYLQRAAQIASGDAEVAGNLAQAYFALGHYDDAQAAFRKAARLNPREVRFQLGVATSIAMQGDLHEAESRLRKLADRYPNHALVWFNLGNVLRDQQRPAEAADSYRRALALDAGLIDARNNFAGLLHALQRLDEAEQEYRACIDVAPDYLAAPLNLASLLIDLGRAGEAQSLCRDVIARAPSAPEGHALLGAALTQQGRVVEALACHRRVVEISPSSRDAIENYAAALSAAGRFDEAWEWFGRAESSDPNSLRGQKIYFSAWLAAGRFAEGWAEYGYRRSVEHFRSAFPDIALSRTLPADLEGKHIVVLREQGLGDEIFFLRYAAALNAAGARVTYRASNKVGPLLAHSPCLASVLVEPVDLPPADAVMLVGDLPHALNTLHASRSPDAESQYSIPPSLELTPRQDKMEDARRRLAAAGAPPYVGITWQAGTPRREQGVEWALCKEISMPPFAAALKEFPGTFLSLQRMPAPGECDRLSGLLARPVHDFSDFNEDLEGMLALLALIDEYVGVSNTNMHLRACVGRAARVLVPCPAEWRWMATGDVSPWFPHFRVYRQGTDGDWSPALARLRDDLRLAFP